MYQVYQIRSGETIESVANKLNTTSDELRRLNGIGDNATIREGSYIIIPNNEIVSSTIDDGDYKKYVVKKGDNLYAIARANNVDYMSLIKINGLKEDEYIYPNQEILIPNKKIYVTSEEKIKDVINKLDLNINQIEDLYLKEDQIINY